MSWRSREIRESGGAKACGKVRNERVEATRRARRTRRGDAGDPFTFRVGSYPLPPPRRRRGGVPGPSSEKIPEDHVVDPEVFVNDDLSDPGDPRDARAEQSEGDRESEGTGQRPVGRPTATASLFTFITARCEVCAPKACISENRAAPGGRADSFDARTIPGMGEPARQIPSFSSLTPRSGRVARRRGACRAVAAHAGLGGRRGARHSITWRSVVRKASWIFSTLRR